jgi:pimeloyl-ACP methyl ester carboxylesterase
VLASSPISWTGNNGFYIIGYSLGGGIAASFTCHYPALVKSLVLLAPGGLVRDKHTAWQSYFLYRTEGILPETIVRWLVRRRLDNPSANSSPITKDGEVKLKVDNAAAAEIGDLNGPNAELARTIDSAVQWQLDHHAGFVPAFISSIRHAPIQNQFKTYIKIGQRQEKLKQDGFDLTKAPEGLLGGRVILILGKNDSVVSQQEAAEDHRHYLGEDNLVTIVLEGGHDLPVSQPGELGQVLWETWEKLEKRSA